MPDPSATPLNPRCRLCLAEAGISFLPEIRGRAYTHCPACGLIAMRESHFLSPEAERRRYLAHENGPGQAGHVRFLMQAVEPALAYLREGMLGLDYGCGPVPTLSALLKARRLDCADFDPLFFPKPPSGPFDFIFATEVFEHFREPAAEIAALAALMKTGGILALMTERWSGLEGLKAWPYLSDPTHVSLYHGLSFDFICGRFGFEKLDDDGKRVLILKKL